MSITNDDGTVLVFTPGVPMTEAEWAAVRAHAADAFHLHPDEILSTPYGYMPMPRPPVGTPEGMGRVPKGLEVPTMCHPVFWLDRPTRRQLDGEDDDVYALRLWLELYDRGYVNVASQRPLNPFDVAGIDSSDPEVHRDLADYAHGQDVGWLRGFVIERPGGSPTRDEMAQRARDTALVHRRNFYDLKAAAHSHLKKLQIRDQAALAQADLFHDGKAVLDAGQALLASPGPDTRRALSDAVTSLLQRIKSLDDHRGSLEIITEAVMSGKVDFGAAVTDPIEQAHLRREAQADQLVAAARHDPSEAALADLWSALSGWHATATTPPEAAVPLP